MQPVQALKRAAALLVCFIRVVFDRCLLPHRSIDAALYSLCTAVLCLRVSQRAVVR